MSASHYLLSNIFVHAVGGGDHQQAGISPLYTHIAVTVAANDDPYGRFLFDPQSREKSIAEDYPVGFSNMTSTSFKVIRSQGLSKEVQVCCL